MTATYWEVGRRIVEFEQGGEKRAGYGEALLKQLAQDLTTRFGRGFSVQNLENMRLFYGAYVAREISQTLSGKSAFTASGSLVAITNSQTPSVISQTVSGKSDQPLFTLADLARAFPLPWSHYVLLISRARSQEAFAFYHAEALRGGWSVRQLDRQMASLFYERVALSKNKAAVLKKGEKPQPADAVSADEEIRDPLVLEFLDLKDEYSESDLESPATVELRLRVPHGNASPALQSCHMNPLVSHSNSRPTVSHPRVLEQTALSSSAGMMSRNRSC